MEKKELVALQKGKNIVSARVGTYAYYEYLRLGYKVCAVRKERKETKENKTEGKKTTKKAKKNDTANK